MNTGVFQKKILDYYATHGRRFPWRNTRKPYNILVSEIMLQQTQVSRVVPKYKLFLKTYPTIISLAQAELKDVLTLWQGLGYNRRAKLLHDTAKLVTKKYSGKLPRDRTELESLPGIGAYTAGAICVFAYNQSSVMIETNIRSVFLHFFFKNKESVSDTDVFKFIQKTVDTDNPRQWYYALMDYGSMLKKTGNPNIKSKHYLRQSSFKGSDRHIRGLILRILLQCKDPITKTALTKELREYDKERILSQLTLLQNEGLTKSLRGRVSVA